MREIKNLLVTGGAGFIGSAFIRYLLSDEINFEGLCVNLDVLTYAGNLENLASIAEDPRYLFVRGDICNGALVEHICLEHSIDAIIHFAAESHVDRSISSPGAFIQTNIVGTFNLLEVVRNNAHIHFHHVSTDEVYGMLGEEGSFNEDSPYKPNSPYSASKAASDHLVRAYGHTYNLSVCLSNCSNNFGPGQFPEKLIPLMIHNCLEEKPLPIYGQGLNIRDWLFVEDHAKALWMLLKEGKKGETYNIGGESEWRNIDLVREIIRCVSELKEIPQDKLERLLTFVPDRLGHDYRYAIDSCKIKRELGWHPSKTFTEHLHETVKWYIERWSNKEGALRTKGP